MRQLDLLGLGKATVVTSLALLALAGGHLDAAVAAPASAAWSVRDVTMPTIIPTSETGHVVLLIANDASAASDGSTVSVKDTLPAGLEVVKLNGVVTPGGSASVECTSTPTTVNCEYAGPIAGDRTQAIMMTITVKAAASGPLGPNAVTVSGGGAPVSSTTAQFTASSSHPGFGLTSFTFEATDENGQPSVQAGAHPNLLTAGFDFASIYNPGLSEGDEIPPVPVRSIGVDLPLGLVGDAQATTTCPEYLLAQNQGGRNCPASSIIGVVAFSNNSPEYQLSSPTYVTPISPLFNVTPEHGYPAEFGFAFSERTAFIYANLAHTSSGYVVRTVTPAITPAAPLKAVELSFFGNPARVDGGAVAERPLLTNATNCSAPPATAYAHVTNWAEPNPPAGIEAAQTVPAVTGCEKLHFDPTLTLSPELTDTDTPTGVNADIRIPQNEQVSGLATPPLKDATVTLPPGLGVSPPSANGLAACPASGPTGIDLYEEAALNPSEPDGLRALAAGHCPGSAIVGSVKVTTPLLPVPLDGSVYLAEPECAPCSEADAEQGRLVKLYFEVAGSGLVLKLPGTVEVGGHGPHSRETGLTPGQLRVRVRDNPQQPVSEISVSMRGGSYGVLSNPQRCETTQASSELVPWSAPATPTATPSSLYTTAWAAGTACPAVLPFAPGLVAGTATAKAGDYSPLTVMLERPDKDQNLGQVTVRTPPGLLASVAGVERCAEQQATAGTCAPGSQIGRVRVTLGPGQTPLSLSGKVFLTTPYEGAPFGLAIVIPAVAGPFNLGTEVVRAKIAVDPTTAALTVTSDSIPASRDGVPIRIRHMQLVIDRPNFTFNASNCVKGTIDAIMRGTPAPGASEAAATLATSASYTATKCASLPFAPKLTASTTAHTSKANGASLNLNIASAGVGQANIAKVQLTIPRSLPTRLTTLQKACAETQFNTNPAGCPAASLIATATVHTPLLNGALSGPVYFVSHGGAAFPDTEIVLQGEGVELILDGHTQIKGGATYSRFESVPDAPFTSFVFTAPQGQYSIFAANGDLCQKKLLLPTVLRAQNGAVINQNTRIAVQGCPRKIRVLSRRQKRGTLTLSVYAPGPGRLTARADGLTTGRKTASGPEALTFTLHNTRHGYLHTEIRISFRSSRGSLQHATISDTFLQ